MRRLYEGGEVLADNEWYGPRHVPPLGYHGDEQMDRIEDISKRCFNLASNTQAV